MHAHIFLNYRTRHEKNMYFWCLIFFILLFLYLSRCIVCKYHWLCESSCSLWLDLLFLFTQIKVYVPFVVYWVGNKCLWLFNSFVCEKSKMEWPITIITNDRWPPHHIASHRYHFYYESCRQAQIRTVCTLQVFLFLQYIGNWQAQWQLS